MSGLPPGAASDDEGGEPAREMEERAPEDDAEHDSPQPSPRSSSPRSPRAASPRGRRASAAFQAQMLGLDEEYGGGEAPVLGVPRLDGDGDGDDDNEWAPLESWKPGDHAVVTASGVDVISSAYDKVGEPFQESVAGQIGQVGTVLLVQGNGCLRLSFRTSEEEVTVPQSILRKTFVVPLEVDPHAAPEDTGLIVRESKHGGLQILGVFEGSEAWKASIGTQTGWWLTHVGRTPVKSREDFIDARGSEVRMEKRVTLPYTFAAATLEDKVERAILGTDLRIYLVFVALFVVFFILDRDVEASYYITQNMRGAVLGNEIPHFHNDDSGIGCVPSTTTSLKWEKTFLDLANTWDWNVWVVTMALPSLLGGSHFGASYSSNIILGGVRFRTLRVRSDSCSVNPDIIPATVVGNQKCYSGFSSGKESKGKIGGESLNYLATFNPRDVSPVWGETPQYRTCGEQDPSGSWSPPLTTGVVELYHCGGYTFEVPFMQNSTAGKLENIDVEKAVGIYRNWACKGFVDNSATRLVAMELFEYSPTHDTFLSVKVFFEVAAGGAWLPLEQYRTFAVWTLDRKAQTALDIIFLLFILYYAGDFVADARRQARRNRPLLAYFMQPWTVLEFINLVLFLVSFGFRFAWYAASNDVNVKIDRLVEANVYPAQLDKIQWLYMMQVYFNSCNVVFTFLKLLKFLRLNSRLNVLTATLADCQDSTIGVLIIFALVVLAFSVAGNTLFGAQMYGYRTLSASFSTLMRMLMGEFDYEAMKRENRVLAGMFFWGFIILGLFILLNFLIGVISESFANVSQRTVPEQMEKVMDKAVSDFKQLCRKDLVKKWVQSRFLKCQTRESLLEYCIDAVDDWRAETYGVQVNEFGEEELMEGDSAEQHTLTKQEFMGALCESRDGQLLDGLGAPYLHFVWSHLVYEFHRSQEAEALAGALRKQAAFESGCRQVLEGKLKIIEQFSRRMDNLNIVLGHMKAILAEKHRQRAMKSST